MSNIRSGSSGREEDSGVFANWILREVAGNDLFESDLNGRGGGGGGGGGKKKIGRGVGLSSLKNTPSSSSSSPSYAATSSPALSMPDNRGGREGGGERGEGGRGKDVGFRRSVYFGVGIQNLAAKYNRFDSLSSSQSSSSSSSSATTTTTTTTTTTPSSSFSSSSSSASASASASSSSTASTSFRKSNLRQHLRQQDPLLFIPVIEEGGDSSSSSFPTPTPAQPDTSPLAAVEEEFDAEFQRQTPTSRPSLGGGVGGGKKGRVSAMFKNSNHLSSSSSYSGSTIGKTENSIRRGTDGGVVREGGGGGGGVASDLKFKLNVENCKKTLLPFVFEANMSSPSVKQWNEQFQTLFGGRILLSLRTLLSEFQVEVSRRVKIIVDDFIDDPDMNTSRRTPIYESSDGLEKEGDYLKNNIFYHLVKNEDNLFLDDLSAAKTMKHQLRAITEFSTKYIEYLLDKELKGEPIINFPLFMMVYYRGHCVTASAVLPPAICTVYGASESGLELHASEQRVTTVMEEISQKLNLQKHRVISLDENKRIYTTPGDIQVDLCIDDRVYLVDAAGIFPPTGPFTGDRKSLMHNRYRLEFLQNQQFPINPDAFKVWNDTTAQNITMTDEVIQKKQMTTLLQELMMVVTRVACILDDKENCLPEGEQLLRTIHRYGLNCRFLGLVYSSVRSVFVRRHLLMEMTTRCLKEKLKLQMTGTDSGKPSELAKFLNLVLEQDAQSWQDLRAIMMRKFFDYSTFKSQIDFPFLSPPNDLLLLLLPTSFPKIVYSACTLAGITIPNPKNVPKVAPNSIEFKTNEIMPLYFHPREMTGLFTYLNGVKNPQEKQTLLNSIVSMCKTYSSAKPEEYHSFLQWGLAKYQIAIDNVLTLKPKERKILLNEALEALSEAIIVKVELPDPYYYCGLVLKQKSKLLDEDVNAFFANMADLESILGSAERVLQTAMGLIEAQGKTPQVALLFDLGEIYQLQAELFPDQKGQDICYTKALNHLYRAIELNPQNMHIYPIIQECKKRRSTPRTPTPRKSGYMVKQGAINKNWKRRYFVLYEDYLVYGVSESSKPKGRIKLSEISEVGLVMDSETTSSGKHCFSVTSKKRIYIFSSDNEEELEEWRKAIQACVAVHNYDPETGKGAPIAPPLDYGTQKKHSSVIASY